jgi:photosystem II stability/assembly factor-like uncharacterized protein
MRRIFLFTVCALFIGFMFSCKKDSSDAESKSGSDAVIGLGKNGTVIRSGDGGNTWTRATVPGEAITHYGYKLAVNDAVYSKDKWIAVGGFGSGAVHKGLVLISTDDGNSWREVKTDATTVLYTVEYCNGIFVAAGMNDNLLTSTDGERWIKVDLKDIIPDPGEPVVRKFTSVVYGEGTIAVAGEVYFTGFASAKYPVILESTDEGKTWSRIVKGGSGGGVDAMVNTNQGIVALAGGGVIYKRGGVWDYDNRSGVPRIYPPLHYTDNTIFATSGLRGRYFTMFNEGSGWEERGDRIANLNIEAVMYGNGRYLYVGSERPLGRATVRAVTYVSTDKGNTWVNTRESLGEKLKGNYCSFRTGVFANGNFIIAGDQSRRPGTPTMIFTSKDGTNWKESVTPGLTVDEHITKLVSGSN